MFHTSNISILGPHTCSHFVILLRLFDLKINKRRRIVCFQKLNFPKRIQRKAEKNGFFLETLHSHSASQKVDRPPSGINIIPNVVYIYIYIYTGIYQSTIWNIFFSPPFFFLRVCCFHQSAIVRGLPYSSSKRTSCLGYRGVPIPVGAEVVVFVDVVVDDDDDMSVMEDHPVGGP